MNSPTDYDYDMQSALILARPRLEGALSLSTDHPARVPTSPDHIVPLISISLRLEDRRGTDLTPATTYTKRRAAIIFDCNRCE
jgi:hypothetical protein